MSCSRKSVLLEEFEQGVEEGCNPSPWAPCPPGEKNYRKEYTIRRTYLPASDAECDCEKEQCL